MNKKLIFIGLFSVLASSMPAEYKLQIVENNKKNSYTSSNSFPYENVIAQEFNRLRGGDQRFSSVEEILNQNLRGKSIEQKNKIIADLKVLKSAVHSAYLQAEHDGKNLWYYLYIWKDNNAIIQSLMQLEYDVDARIADCEGEVKTDVEKFIRYITPFAAGMLTGITLLYLAQGNLDYNYYVEHKHHGLLEMFQAPTLEAIKAGALGVKGALMLTGKAAEGIKYGAEAGASVL